LGAACGKISAVAQHRFFKWRWDEDRGDEYASWGGTTYYFTTDASGIVSRQIEIYDDGHVLMYDEAHASDAFGMLSDQPLDLTDMAGFEVSEAEFAAATRELRPFNA
jgi:hypothetical protein